MNHPQTSFCDNLCQDRGAIPGVETQKCWEHRSAPYTPQLHQVEVGTGHPSYVGQAEGWPAVFTLHLPRVSRS